MVKKVFSIVLMMIFAIIYSSCSNSDEDSTIQNTDNYDFKAGQFIGSNGQKVRLKSVGYDTYTYDDSSNMVSCYTHSGNNYVFTYNPFEITYTDNGETLVKYSGIQLNSKGYISSISTESPDGKGKAVCTYDNEHITKITYQQTLINNENSHPSNFVFTFSWSNDQLISITKDVQEVNNIFTVVNSFQYEDNANLNITYQWTPSEFGDMMIDRNIDFKFLFYLGYFGKGGKRLPVSCIFNATNIDHHYSINTQYTFNEDGSVKTANNYSFTYIK